MMRHVRFSVLLAIACLCSLAKPAHATILTFEIFDSNPFFLNGNFNNSGVEPFYSAAYGYPEGYRIYSGYGNNVEAASGTAVTLPNGNARYEFDQPGGIKYLYDFGAEGSTPNVTASYGPYSIFTGGPALWREGYSGLDGILYQGSGENGSPIGNDYDILDIVLVADAGYDVVLYDFDLGSYLTDRTINSIMAFGGVPFPFLTPSNYIYGPTGPIDVPGAAPYHQSFSVNGLQASAIWLRIDMNNLGLDSINVGIDNLRFGQVENPLNTSPLDPGQIDAAFQSAEVPEPASLTLWLVGGSAMVFALRRRKSQTPYDSQ